MYSGDFMNGPGRLASVAAAALLLMGALASPEPAAAHGPVMTATDQVDDATLVLAVESTLSLVPPSADWCLVEIEVVGDEVALTAGDSVAVWVYEDDAAGDDLFFATTFVVTATEVANQRVDRFFDCSTDPLNILDAVGEYSELYAAAHVFKDACGVFCFDDRPETGLLDVLVVEHVSAVPALGGARLENAYPNPFNPQTTIAFDLARPEIVRLTVFDVSGRLVDVLLDHESAAEGRHEVVWRGRDLDGRVVPAGVYFYRLVAGSFSETKRMVLVK